MAAEGPAQAANFLIVGSDSRQFVENQEQQQAFGDPKVESGQRSDTIMVLRQERNGGAADVVLVGMRTRGFPLAQRLAAREGLDLSRCSAYSDSSNDIPMLSLVGQPVAINPDAALRRAVDLHPDLPDLLMAVKPTWADGGD